MPEKDTSNLPILDDIIVPGDVEKAAPTPPSKVQSSLLAGDDGAKTAVALSATPIASERETDDDDNADSTAFPIAEHDDEDAVVNAHVPLATETVEELPQTPDPLVDRPTPNADINPLPVNAPNIDALTEEILNSLMPAVEHLLSEKIRQTLKQHLANTDLE
jgi:hypothetical protein